LHPLAGGQCRLNGFEKYAGAVSESVAERRGAECQACRACFVAVHGSPGFAVNGQHCWGGRYQSASSTCPAEQKRQRLKASHLNLLSSRRAGGQWTPSRRFGGTVCTRQITHHGPAAAGLGRRFAPAPAVWRLARVINQNNFVDVLDCLSASGSRPSRIIILLCKSRQSGIHCRPPVGGSYRVLCGRVSAHGRGFNSTVGP
jgi:hypothetical protein